MFDVLLLAENWLAVCQDAKANAGIGDVYRDCGANILDFAKVSKGWLDCTWECE